MHGFRFWSSLKSDPREKLRRSCLRPAADETKLPVAREKKPLVPRVPRIKQQEKIRILKN